jgi:glycosyltransferase involved in cell wall biosynthesis
VREISLRRFVAGPPAAPDRVGLLSIWFHHHNNPRYAELLPRLGRLDACLLRLSRGRIPRGLQYRAYRATRPLFYRAALDRGRARYLNLLTLDFEQLAAWRGAAVMDADDPFFRPREVELLNRPALQAYVVTAERAARRYESLGVSKPWVVIPQGISMTTATPELVAEAGSRKRPGERVVGWMAAHLLTAGDRGAEGPLYNVDHLLDLWEEVHARAPQARLWLVGGATDRLRRRLGDRDDVVLFGRLPRDRALATASHFDVAVYARTQDTGVQAAKVAEFMGLGVPTVSYDYEVTEHLRETGAGLLVPDAREFVDAVVRFVTDENARAPVAEAARRAGEALDWDVLARRFEEEVLDRYLPPSR